MLERFYHIQPTSTIIVILAIKLVSVCTNNVPALNAGFHFLTNLDKNTALRYPYLLIKPKDVITGSVDLRVGYRPGYWFMFFPLVLVIVIMINCYYNILLL